MKILKIDYRKAVVDTLPSEAECLKIARTVFQKQFSTAENSTRGSYPQCVVKEVVLMNDLKKSDEIVVYVGYNIGAYTGKPKSSFTNIMITTKE